MILPTMRELLVKHASGSHLEFKSDGSIHLKAVKDVHTHTSVLSDQNGKAKGADSTTNRADRDYTWEVGGRLKIKCSELDFEVDTTGRIVAGTDLITSANNVITKGTESISLEQRSRYTLTPKR